MEDEPIVPDFVPGRCLFCAHVSGSLDASTTHMTAAHGFSVPFQDCLAVDLETLIAYLHFVIHGYRECICCGTRRNTVGGVQQHMVAKGHCRFDLTSDIEEFYEMSQSGHVPVENLYRGSSVPVRLPSGKLISHRKQPEPLPPRPSRRSTPNQRQESFALPSRTTSAPSLEVAQRRGENDPGQVVPSSEAILAAQLSKLQIAADRAQQKEEKRKRGRLEGANNLILFKHYRLDSGDSRIGRKFC
jgi:pre-60S factor REI1